MGIFDILSLICGLALFLFGMNVMSEAIKRSTGSRMKTILGGLTSNKWKGFALGFLVTAIIQSSSATTVMVVGFVNSGIMTLTQAVGVILGANVGTAVTSWLTGTAGIGSSMEWLKPSSWIPILALFGIGLLMFAKRDKKRDIGMIFLGFVVLMVGMDTMSDAVSVLKTNESFKQILVMFKNPIFGLIAGAALTAIIQSSSASVGILQSLTTTGAVTYGIAIPIIMGQNIGTCITALLSSIGTTKNAKRATLIHLYFNTIGSILFLCIFYLLHALIQFPFIENSIGMWGIALVHTLFNLFGVIVFMPFTKWLVKLAEISIRDSKDKEEIQPLDDRLLNTPSIAIAQCTKETYKMAKYAYDAMLLSLEVLNKGYDDKKASLIREYEDKGDHYEDMLGSYLIKISGCSLQETETHEITKLLHIIGDLERISDHAVNLLISAEEMQEKKIHFSEQATFEISVLTKAIEEILGLTYVSFVNSDLQSATLVEPLEEVVDELREQIKLHHVLRLQKSECTIEHGFVLSDILTNLIRVSDHCSNIAGCELEMTQHDTLNMHEYLNSVKNGGNEFDRIFSEYQKKYSLEKA